MRLKKYIANIKIFRLILLPIFRYLDFNIKIKHDVTKRNFFIKLYSHKGYWYYGKERENEELEVINKWIKKGDSILEIGAHIGYFTQIFEDLVSETGRVIVVEPTPISINFLKKNINNNSIIIPKAASRNNGSATLYIEKFGGFTNSLNQRFTKLKNRTHQSSQNIVQEISSIEVETETIDNICSRNMFVPKFIKIDVEDAELQVLLGALEILKISKYLMIEINSNKDEIFNLLIKLGYIRVFNHIKNNNYFFEKK
tara:strand:+ start:46 stop:813 length:768 start_codon:yes stop_codon:yes gene_type:complete